MVDYHFDLYPSDDPRDGAALVRFSADTALQSADYRDVIGVGAGQFLLRATRPEAAFLEPAGEQYVRVVRDDGSTELVIGGFWTNEIRYGAALAKETKPLTVGGAGVMAYLARSVMAPHSYIHEAAGVFVGQDPFDRIWRLYEQGAAAGGDFLGAVLWRVIFEAQHFRTGTTPYTHKHADGLIYTDIHDNDRRRSAIPDLTLGFDQFEDSDGNAWTMPSGSFTAQVGENVLQVVRRLMEAGLYVEMDPDTFELRAWEGSDHRRDRTGGAWGAAVVRLQAPTDGTIATGNVKSDSERLISSHVRRTTIWAGGADDVYGFADTPTGTPWEGFAPSDMADVPALDNLADIQLTAREESGDVLTARLKLGDAPSDGRYLPWEHVKLDDLVTVHTGAAEWDYDEATYPVAALRIHLRDGGDWDAWVDLGASFEAMAQRQFEVSATPAHSHPPNPMLCPPAHPGLAASCLLDPSAMTELPTPNGDFEQGDTEHWDGAVLVAGDPTGAGGSWASQVTSVGSAGWAYWWDDDAVLGRPEVARVWVTSTGGFIRFGSMAVTGSGAVAGDYTEQAIVAGWNCLEWTPSSAVDNVKLHIHQTGSGALGTDGLQRYTGGEDTNEHNGVSNLAARCDHTHPGDEVDHGGLSGLGDDDHPQYQTEAEVDAQIDAAIGSLAASDLATRWTPVTTWNGDHWIIVTDGSGTPVLTEVT